MLTPSLGINNNKGPLTPSSCAIGGISIILVGLVCKIYYDKMQAVQIVADSAVGLGGAILSIATGLMVYNYCKNRNRQSEEKKPLV